MESRFFCTGQSRTEFNQNGTGGTTLCFDMETGELITELPFDDGRQFILDDKGSRVALIRNVSGVRSLQVYDVDSGEATGEPIALSDDVDLLEMKSDGDRIFVTRDVTSGDLIDFEKVDPEATQQRCLVEVYELETGKLVGPPVPASSPQMMAMSADSQTLSIV